MNRFYKLSLIPCLCTLALLVSCTPISGPASTAPQSTTPALEPTVGEVATNGITIAYESFGALDDETILLIAGTGMQLTGWPIELIEELVQRGYRVVRFDNRDIGRSTKLTAAGLPDAEAIGKALEAGKPAPIPYTLQDMAADAVGLLDALAIQQAHIVGISMGGAIAQFIAIDYPERALSLTSLAADSGNPELPVIAKPEAFEGVPMPPNSFRLLKDRSRQLDKELTGKSSVGMIGVLVTVRAKGQRKRPIMSKIPTRLTEKQFAEHIDPYLSKAKRGFTCQIPRYKVFNYIL